MHLDVALDRSLLSSKSPVTSVLVTLSAARIRPRRPTRLQAYYRCIRRYGSLIP